MERNGIEYSESSNLPLLPAGMHWQIKEHSSWLGLSIVIETTKPKRFFGFIHGETTELVTHEDYYRYLDLEELDDDSIKDKAERIYKELMITLEAKERVKALVGIYPPKKLEL